MRILDLFSGLGGRQRRTFIENRGHEYITLDIDPGFLPTITSSIFDVDPQALGRFDFVWASPPCQGFSVASLYRNWNKDGSPKSKLALLSQDMVLKTLDIIKTIDPPAWLIENPRGMLRTMEFMKPYDRRTITYCQYGDTRMKPTDLWGRVPGWTPRLPCRNGDPCHDRAPRGTKQGTQGIASVPERAVVPQALWEEILDALEGQPSVVHSGQLQFI